MKNASVIITLLLIFYNNLNAQNTVKPVFYHNPAPITLFYNTSDYQPIKLSGNHLDLIDLSSIRSDELTIANKEISSDGKYLSMDVIVKSKIDHFNILYSHSDKTDELFKCDVVAINHLVNKFTLTTSTSNIVFPDEDFEIDFIVSGKTINWSKFNVKDLKCMSSDFEASHFRLFKDNATLKVRGNVKYKYGVFGSHKVSIINTSNNEILSSFLIEIKSPQPVFKKPSSNYKISDQSQEINLTGDFLYDIKPNSLLVLNSEDEFILEHPLSKDDIFEDHISLKIKIFKDKPLRVKFDTWSNGELTRQILFNINKILVNDGKLLDKVYISDITNNHALNKKLNCKLEKEGSGTYKIICDDINFLNDQITINSDTCEFKIKDIKADKVPINNNDLNTTIYLMKGEQIAFSIPIVLRSEPKIERLYFEDSNSNILAARSNTHYDCILHGTYLEDIAFKNHPSIEISRVPGNQADKFRFKFKNPSLKNTQKYILRYYRVNNMGKQTPDTLPVYLKPPFKVFTDYKKKAASFDKPIYQLEDKIKFKIDGKEIDPSFGYQYVKLKADIYDESNKHQQTIYYNNQTSVKIANPIYNSKNIISWEISKDLKNYNLRPFNTIEVTVIPEDKTGDEDYNNPEPIEVRIDGSEIDKWRIEPSVPAMIFMVSTKKFANDSVSIAQGGPENLRYQVVTGSVGLTVYRQFYNKRNRPNGLSMGAYFLTSNLLSSSDSGNKIVNKYDFTFIPYMQFKLYSNEKKLSVPIFLGPGFTYNSKRDEWITSVMLGISLNLTL